MRMCESVSVCQEWILTKAHTTHGTGITYGILYFICVHNSTHKNTHENHHTFSRNHQSEIQLHYCRYLEAKGKNVVFLFSLSFEHNFYLVRESRSLPLSFLMLNVLRKSFKCISSCFSFVLPFFFFFFFSPYSSSSSPRLSSARMRL